MIGCSIPDCNKPARGHGMCSAHYSRWRRHGDPSGGRTSRGELLRYLHEVVLEYEGDDCLEWPYSRSGNGYAMVWIDGRQIHATRVICEHANGAPPSPDHHAAHSCGRGHLACVTKRHLSWKTPKENNADKLEHGTHRRGERNVFAKLTSSEVVEIRKLFGSASLKEIASTFGVSDTALRNIQSGRTWSWL